MRSFVRLSLVAALALSAVSVASAAPYYMQGQGRGAGLHHGFGPGNNPACPYAEQYDAVAGTYSLPQTVYVPVQAPACPYGGYGMGNGYGMHRGYDMGMHGYGMHRSFANFYLNTPEMQELMKTEYFKADYDRYVKLADHAFALKKVVQALTDHGQSVKTLHDKAHEYSAVRREMKQARFALMQKIRAFYADPNGFMVRERKVEAVTLPARIDPDKVRPVKKPHKAAPPKPEVCPENTAPAAAGPAPQEKEAAAPVPVTLPAVPVAEPPAPAAEVKK